MRIKYVRAARVKTLFAMNQRKCCIIRRQYLKFWSKGAKLQPAQKDAMVQLLQAPAPLHILPKIKATEELLSFLVVSKMDDRQPLYHLEKQLRERYGVDCSRQSMANWVIALMTPLQPIFNLMKDEVIDYDVASIDATTLQVLNEPGRKAETKSYVYCIRGGQPQKSVVLYAYNHINGRC